MTSLPVLAGLLRSGVPFGPTMAFLLASPLLDAPILGVLVFLIGPKLTALYAVVTFVAAMGLAALFARLGLGKDIQDLAKAPALRGAPIAAGAPEVGPTPAPLAAIPAAGGGVSAAPAPGGGASAGERERRTATATAPTWRRAWGRVREAWSRAWDAFVPMVPRLAVGLVIAAAFEAFVPTGELLAIAGPDQPFAIPLMAVLGLPVHGMASMLLPMIAPLVEKGVPTGAVVAFVVTALGVSVPQLAMQRALVRPRLIAVLVLSNVMIAVAIGALMALVAG